MKDSLLESQNTGWAARYTVTAMLKMTIERKLWGGVLHMRELSFPLVHAFQANIWTKGNPSGSSFHQKSLPYRPNHSSLTIHSGSHGLGPWLTKIIPGFYWIFNGLCVGLNIYRALMLVLLAAYPLAWSRSLLHVLWSDRDPYCMFSDLTEILFFFLYCYYYFFLFFLLFGILGLYGPS